MRLGSLFAGIGGFDLAAERAGMEVVFQSENDAKASAVLKHHWPEVPNYGDIHNMGVPVGSGGGRRHARDSGGDKPDTEERDNPGHMEATNGRANGRGPLPGVDVLTGGFPCQDYSVAGNRGGLAGDRGALWWEYHRLISTLRPTWIVGENVPGLLSSRDGADFETIVGSLTELGYGVAWAVLDARYFGVAQRRRRVFIVGHSGGVPRPEVLALGEGLFGHPVPCRETGERTAPTLAARTNGGGWPGSDEAIDGALASGQTPAVAFAQNQRDEIRELGDQAGALAAEPGMKQQTYVASSVAVRGRDDGQEWELGEPGLANALRAGDGGSSRSDWMTDAAQVRRLTPLECERLQGFPDGWTGIPGNSDTQRYRQLGNAVAVPVVEWLMERIAHAR